MARPNFSSGGKGNELAQGVRVGGARYILKRLLGHGEVSEVWLAHDVKEHRDVALKFLPEALLSDENVIERLKDEVRRNLLLAHPHIVSTYELVRDHYSAAIVMEYVDGWSLAALKVDRPGRRYRVGEIEWWVRQLCTALEFAHNECGIIHRDLKPSNLLITTRDDLKVTDFGLAQSIRNESSRHGLVKGVYSGIGFLSPQQVMGEKPSRLDDVYSLGATLFDLLTGTPPFYKGEIVAQVCSLKPPTMTERLRELGLEDSIPAGLEKTVAACLAKEPRQRPQTVNEVLQMLEREPAAEMPGTPVEAPVAPKEISDVSEAAESSEPAGEQPSSGENPPGFEPLTSSSISDPPPPGGRSRLPAAVVAAAVVIVLGMVMAGFLFFKKGKGVAGGRAALIDPAFKAGSGTDDHIRSFALLPDGRILASGRFASFNGSPHRGLVRLSPDGELDAEFKPQPQGTVHTVVPYLEGDILIGGDFGNVGGTRRTQIARLDANGGLAPDFQGGADAEIRTLAVLPDGSFLAGGSFTAFNGSKRGRITRLGPRGFHYGAAGLGDGASAIVWTIVRQPDEKILVGGGFTRYAGAPAGRLVRLNPEGGLDPAFDAGAGADAPVLSIVVQPDGRIIAAGDFIGFNGQLRNRIVRLNANGSVDRTFDPGIGPNNNVRSVALQPDGKMIIGGIFTTVQGVPCNRLARLNRDGSLDRSFDTSRGLDGSVWNICLQKDGKILVGGYFKAYNGVPCGGIVRLLGDSK